MCVRVCVIYKLKKKLVPILSIVPQEKNGTASIKTEFILLRCGTNYSGFGPLGCDIV